MSLMPANSHTARTGPPAITPVPSLDGFNRTLPAPNSPIISWGYGSSYEGTSITCFLASWIAFLMASGISRALAIPPTPT